MQQYLRRMVCLYFFTCVVQLVCITCTDAPYTCTGQIITAFSSFPPKVERTLQQCSWQLGNDFQATSPGSSVGLLVNDEAVAGCNGVAKRWNFCFYNSTNATSIATFLVYRKQIGNNTYAAVRNSSTVFNYTKPSNSSYFTCLSIPITNSFEVQPGDIIAVCTSGKQPLAVVGSDVGTCKNKLLRGDFNNCEKQFDPANGAIVSYQSKILHVYLGIHLDTCIFACIYRMPSVNDERNVLIHACTPFCTHVRMHVYM